MFREPQDVPVLLVGVDVLHVDGDDAEERFVVSSIVLKRVAVDCVLGRALAKKGPRGT